MEKQTLQTKRWYETFTMKMILLGILGLTLLIPLEMVKNLIRERSFYADEAKKEIENLWSSFQTITGPVLNIPGKKIVSEEGKYTTTTLHILPENIMFKALIKPEVRYRGIYEAVVYESDIEIIGNFTFDDLNIADEYIYYWDQAYVSLGISDNRGLTGGIVLHLDSLSIEAEPGIAQTDVFNNGITFPANISSEIQRKCFGLFHTNFKLKGSEGISFSPVGKTTKVEIVSSWTAPSFQGNFIPFEKEITTDGFKAAWLITHLNRNFPQVWNGKGFSPEEEAFGVNMIIEVDHYRKAERCAKYGILFILLTFFVLVIFEIRSSERIHIFYYLLVAFALILFFSLLNALSEKLGFNPAYLVSSIATISLLCGFFYSLINKRWIVMVIGGMLSVLYIFIFILLALKDYAYLAGNIGLFVLLGILMLVSSKYRIFS